MGMAEPIETGARQVGEWAVMIENHGIAILVCAIALMFGVAYGLIWIKELRRKKSGLFIERKHAWTAILNAQPGMMVFPLEELPKLTQHPVFALWENELRTVDRFVIKLADNSVDQHRTEVCQDLLSSTVRATRNLVRGIVEALYEYPDKFDERLGDESAFRDMFGREYAGLIQAVRQHLQHLALPPGVIQAYADYMDISDMIADRMLERSADHPLGLNYFRLHSVLETQYARGLGIKRMIEMLVRPLDCSAYERKPEATESTMGSFAASPAPSVHSMLMDPNAIYKPKF